MKITTINILLTLLIACLLVSILFGTMRLAIIYQPHTEVRYCKVVEIDNGIIVLETTDGNLWEYETGRDFWIDEIVRVRFDNMGTESIYDDEIISIRR